MKKDPDTTRKAAELRSRAKQRLQAQSPDGDIADADTRKLLQELQVHQIELEIQNEELQQARAAAEAAAAHFTELYESAPVGYFTLERDGKILQSNLTGAELLGIERGKLTGHPFMLFVDSKDRSAFRQFLERVLAGQNREYCELALERKGDEPCLVHIESVADTSDHSCLMAVTDITARKQVEERMRLAVSVFSSMDEGVLVSDRENRIVSVNPAFSEITGYAADEVIGGNPRMLASGKHPPEFYREMWERLSTTESWQGEIWNRAKNGEVYIKWLSIKQIRDENGQPVHYVAIFSDLTRRKAAAEEYIYHLAYYDALTDLPNRVLLFDRLHQALKTARRDKTQLALLFLDLDEFKAVNDKFGHNIGDQLLQEAATRILACMRESDTAARMGGDEFVILLPGIEGKRDATIVAEKIRNALARPYELSGSSLRLGSSIGIAVYPAQGAEEKTLLNKADAAMYCAKQKGGNNIELFKEGAHEFSADRHEEGP
jgi:diguanylate cyclase (GGDEF)-like protein/PAS domain S-box-containing protein